MYERIDDYLYEPIDDKIVQQKEGDTPIVGDTGDNIPTANCPAYATSPITAPSKPNFYVYTHIMCFYYYYPILVSSPSQGETNEEQDVDEYEDMS